jgi:protein TonB
VDGKVKNVKVVSGPPLLRNAAIQAVKQWVYKPTLLNGKPIEAETRITLNFVTRR